jgi:hypothetical protein
MITCWLLIVYTCCLMCCLAASWLTMTHSLDSDLYIKLPSTETQALSLFSLCNTGLQCCFPDFILTWAAFNKLLGNPSQSSPCISSPICPACKGLLSNFKNEWSIDTMTCQWHYQATMKKQYCGHLYSPLNRKYTLWHLRAQFGNYRKGECGVSIHSIIWEWEVEYCYALL